MARAEGEKVAAAVLEQPGPNGAHRLWGEAVGRPAQDFFTAVPRGRRYASIPTTLLSTLVAEGSPRAAGYAQALADVATAAATVSGAGAVAVGKATSVARAQLAAAGAAPAHGPGTPTEGLTPPEAGVPTSPAPGGTTGGTTSGTDQGDLQAWSNDLLRRAMDQGDRIREMLGHLPGSPGSGQPPAPAGGGPGEVPGQYGIPADPGSGPSTHGTAVGEGATGQAQEDPSGTPAVEEEPEDERTVEELLAELDALVGLEPVKAEIHRQVAVLKMDARRQEAGLKVVTLTRHLVFVGNPGTGKTTVARLVGGIYRALGLLSKGQLVEVDRSELVAGYLGQTAAKTSDVVASALGGVLFIDEAYSLNGDQYGKESIDTLVKEMEDHRDDLVVIVAGYPEPMAEFVASNPGLESRFRTIIEFDDYSDEELVAIQTLLAQNMDYDIAPEATERFREILAATPRGPSFGNGRFARNMLEAAIGRHAWRLRDDEDASIEELRTLQRQDFEDRDAVDLAVKDTGMPPAEDDVADQDPWLGDVDGQGGDGQGGDGQGGDGQGGDGSSAEDADAPPDDVQAPAPDDEDR
ncbi:AAA family ATPase [Ornithinimicrobium pratense]|uniref:AAA family ATPase n=2 Tax=Ornithinimicrobium pratense TaxID=2593973 RepID=A0A5J6VAJ3_9MICO|nr:AAA family ATPase [Ornithinimicrobium pratense]